MVVILHAEDDKHLREVFARCLIRMGHNVLSVEDGEIAWKLLGDMPKLPDLIISDFEMPGMTGGQLLSKVRGDLRLSPIPFTLFSATKRDFEGVPLAELCAKYGAHYVDKGAWDGDMEPLLKPLGH